MRERLKRYIGEQLLGNGHVPLGVEDDLLEIGVDSVGMMTLVLFIEREWQVNVPPEDVVLENFQSIAAIERYIRGRAPRAP
jgi:acyl carrier protein